MVSGRDIALGAAGLFGLYWLLSSSDSSADVLKDAGQEPRQDWSDMNLSVDRPELDMARMVNPVITFSPSGQVITPSNAPQGANQSLDYLAAMDRETRFRQRWGVPSTFNARDMANFVKNGVNGLFQFPVSLDQAPFLGDYEARRFTIAIEKPEDLEYFESLLASMMLATFNPSDPSGAALETEGIKEIFQFFGYHRFLIPENTEFYMNSWNLTHILPASETTEVMAGRLSGIPDASGRLGVIPDESIKRYIRNGWGWGAPSECIPYFREGFFNESTFGADRNRPTGRTYRGNPALGMEAMTQEQRDEVKRGLLDGGMLLFERAFVRFSNVIMQMMSGASPSHISDLFQKIGVAALALVGGAAGAAKGNISGLVGAAGNAVKTAIEFVQALNSAEELNEKTQEMIDAHIRRVMGLAGFSHDRFLGYRLRCEANWSGFRIGYSRTLKRYLRNFVLQRDGIFTGCGAVIYPQIPMFLRMPKFGVICYAGNNDNFGVSLRFNEAGTMPIGWYPFKITHRNQMVEIIDYEQPTSVPLSEFNLGTTALRFSTAR